MAKNGHSILQCHSISLTDPLKKTDLTLAVEKLVKLCKAVFDPDNSGPDVWPYHLDAWLERLERPYAQALYVTTGDDDSEPRGFFLSLPKPHPDIGHETYHISLAGVDPSARGLGIFPLLLEQTKRHARSAGFVEMSVCTYPARFPKMFRLLSDNGWELVSRSQEVDGEKVLMRLKI